jgi:hypothetical protein
MVVAQKIEVEVKVVKLAEYEALGRPLHLRRGSRSPFSWDNTAHGWICPFLGFFFGGVSVAAVEAVS